ncbi:MAG: ATPase domain-containing protein [Thermoplasmata archaeon]
MTLPNSSEVHLENRIATGISAIDGVFGGGLPSPGSILLFSQTVSEKRLLAHLFTVKGLQRGERCLYIDFYRSPQLARRDFQRYKNVDVSKLTVIDAVSSQLILPTEEKYFIKNVNDLGEIEEVVSRAIDDTSPQRVVLDSLEFLADKFPKEKVTEFIENVGDLIQKQNAVIMLLFFNLLYDTTRFSELRRSVDILLEFKQDRVEGLSKNFIRVHKYPGSRTQTTEWIPVSFDEAVQDLNYVPRLLITGPKSSGKTAVVEFLNPHYLEVSGGRKVGGLTPRRVEISNIEAEIFGEPTEERFKTMTKLFVRELDGILFVLDATDREKMTKASHVLRLIGGEIPIIVLANKSDLPDSLTPEEIRKVMRLPRSIEVMPTIATTGEGVWEAMWLLLMKVFGEKALWV